MSKARGLGRGFESLIPTDVLDETFDPTAKSDEKVSELRYIAISEIVPDAEQPRRSFDEEALEELAQSIQQHGLVQPIVVTVHKDGYQIVAGERRWRAAQIAGLVKLPAIVRTLGNQHKLELALIENLQRRDLNPLEIATGYLKLSTQFNLTHEQIAERVSGGKAVSTISNSLRLLKLPAESKDALVRGDISEGHARQILAIADLEAQKQLLELILKEGWSVRKAEQFVIGYKKGNKEKEAKTTAAIKHTKTETPFTQTLSARLKTNVKHKTTAHGGQIIITYKDEKDLSRLEKLLA